MLRPSAAVGFRLGSGDIRRYRVNGRLVSFLLKNAPVHVVGDDGFPKPVVKEVYPYFLTDLLTAWDGGKEAGAREVLDEAVSRVNERLFPAAYWWVSGSSDFGPVVVCRVDDEGRNSYSLNKHWVVGEFLLPDGGRAVRLVWHCHVDRAPGAWELRAFAR